MPTTINNVDKSLKKCNAIIKGVSNGVKKITVNNSVLVWTGSEELLANAGVTNLHANCYTPDSGSNSDYSDTISFSWDDIDNLNIKGYYKTARKGNGDWHSYDDFKIQILVDSKWLTIWEASTPDGGWSTGTWNIDTTITTESYTGTGQIRCYCKSERPVDHSITNYLDIDISGVTTNVY